jgi:hypothetical protein
MEQRHGAIELLLSGGTAGDGKMDLAELFGLSGFLLRRCHRNPQQRDECREEQPFVGFHLTPRFLSESPVGCAQSPSGGGPKEGWNGRMAVSTTHPGDRSMSGSVSLGSS